VNIVVFVFTFNETVQDNAWSTIKIEEKGNGTKIIRDSIRLREEGNSEEVKRIFIKLCTLCFSIIALLSIKVIIVLEVLGSGVYVTDMSECWCM
jgi:hypothetical protein